ncbi:MAG: HAD family phosphatase [Eubacteriales bacterium]|nr:HAD family phosphatase [Eubacteriales bacterium]
MRKKAVIFDMDGVIIDSEGIYLDNIYRFVKSYRPDVQKSELYQVVGRGSRDSWERIAEVSGTGYSWEEMRHLYRDEWERDHVLKIDYKEIFRKEIAELLNTARHAGLKTAVASSTRYELVVRVMQETGISGLLDLIMSGEFFERSKPDPSIYLKTAELLHVLPEECLVLEDSTVGIRAAHAAGMEVAALIDDRFCFDRSLADHEIKNLMEFSRFF